MGENETPGDRGLDIGFGFGFWINVSSSKYLYVRY
jgi:hypothetical protein